MFFVCFRRPVDLLGPEFDLEGAPASVLELEDRVDHAARITLVMEEFRPKRFRVDPQIVLAKGFEKEPKRLEINARSSFLIVGFGGLLHRLAAVLFCSVNGPIPCDFNFSFRVIWTFHSVRF